LLYLQAIKVEPDRREQQTFKRTKRQKVLSCFSYAFLYSIKLLAVELFGPQF